MYTHIHVHVSKWKIVYTKEYREVKGLHLSIQMFNSMSDMIYLACTCTWQIQFRVLLLNVGRSLVKLTVFKSIVSALSTIPSQLNLNMVQSSEGTKSDPATEHNTRVHPGITTSWDRLRDTCSNGDPSLGGSSPGVWRVLHEQDINSIHVHVHVYRFINSIHVHVHTYTVGS